MLNLSDDVPDTAAVPQLPHQDARHLQPGAREALGWSVEERVFYALEDHWIGHGAASQALATIGDLLRRPQTTTPPSLLIIGRAGNGKTTILQRFVEHHPPTTRTTGDLTSPVVSMSLPPGASERGFWSELLFACGGAHRVTDPAAVTKAATYRLLRSLQPRVLVCDEINNLLLGSGAEQRHLMAVIREVTSKLSLHLVLAGTEAARDALNHDAQLNRRLDRFVLPRWSLDREFLRLLRSLEGVVPLPVPSQLAGEEIATEIHRRSDGSIGSISRLVKEAAALAIRSGREKIDVDLIRSIPSQTSEARQLREAAV